MSGSYGNPNLAKASGFQYLTVNAGSKEVTIPAGITMVDLISAEDCFVVVGRPGETPVASAPGAEKTDDEGMFLPAGLVYTIAIPLGTDENQVKIAAIQVTSGGALYFNYRSVI